MNDHVWRTSLKIGDLLDCLDTDNKWFEGIVVTVSSEGVTVHFRGWSSRYDVFESFFSPRIQQPYTRTVEWRKRIGVGDFVEVKDNFTGVYLWFIGTVVQIDRVHGKIRVRYSHIHNKLGTFNIEGDRVSYLGTHIRIDQHVTLTKETIRYISERHFERWNCRCEEESSFSCCICYSNVKNIVLNPCNHLCVCSKCSSNESLKKCPLCQTSIVSKIFVYV